MIFIFGRYRIAKKEDGYRYDVCRSCEEVRLIKRTAWWPLIHVFWIPILPFFKQHSWQCQTCKKSPFNRYKSNKWIKGLITLFSLLVTALLFLAQEEQQTIDHITTLQVLSVAINLSCFYWLFKYPQDESKVHTPRQYYSLINQSQCPFCHHLLSFANKHKYCQCCKLTYFRKDIDKDK